MDLSQSQLLADFHHAYYSAGSWANSTWRGHLIHKYPTDLLTYHELIFSLRPSLIIETGTRYGGSALFFGDMLDLTEQGRVISIDNAALATPYHSRVTYLQADSSNPFVGQQISQDYGYCHPILVILDSDHRREHVLAELDTWSPLVTPGSYLVVEDTNLNGNPVCPEFGPGPSEALAEWLPQHPEFEIDRSKEKFMLTTNPGGWLRKVR